ncbi:MAG: thioredoxin domain-containing protein, partial [Gammaproteobacteria bacterium]|nr:thioredoxin domain-containing protein [Gammaproteobacteria bacterium]
MPNRLSDETSPYLLQHADNPVDWHAWNDTALNLARSSGKPILLSVGYSACHWCHVMAHECFEDEPTAALMNRLFINIKVDREERPDIDKIYQQAHQLISQNAGGWPLTVFLTPEEHLPIFSGTYFPREMFK